MSPPREETTLGVVGKPAESAEGASVMIGVSTPGVGRKADLGCGRLNEGDSEELKRGFCPAADENGTG